MKCKFTAWKLNWHFLLTQLRYLQNTPCSILGLCATLISCLCANLRLLFVLIPAYVTVINPLGEEYGVSSRTVIVNPLVHMSGIFLKSLTNGKYTFPVESIRVQWIQRTPSERLSTPSYNMSGNFLSLSRIENILFQQNLSWCPMDHLLLIGLFTKVLPVFQCKARGYDWSLCKRLIN